VLIVGVDVSHKEACSCSKCLHHQDLSLILKKMDQREPEGRKEWVPRLYGGGIGGDMMQGCPQIGTGQSIASIRIQNQSIIRKRSCNSGEVSYCCARTWLMVMPTGAMADSWNERTLTIRERGSLRNETMTGPLLVLERNNGTCHALRQVLWFFIVPLFVEFKQRVQFSVWATQRQRKKCSRHSCFSSKWNRNMLS
jgi:hypothetical protein